MHATAATLKRSAAALQSALAVFAGLTLLATAPAARAQQAQPWPARPIRVKAPILTRTVGTLARIKMFSMVGSATAKMEKADQ